MREHLCLVGFKGAGKTYLGRRLAAHLGLPFWDTDEVLRDLHGSQRTCREIVEGFGESHFRDLERRAVMQVLSRPQAVIATGGGTPVCPYNRSLLSELGRVIYLEAMPQTLRYRLTHTGFFAWEEWELRLQQRLPHYRAVAHWTLQADHLEEAWRDLQALTTNGS